MSVVSPVSLGDSRGGPPLTFNRQIASDEAEFPLRLRRYRLGLALFVAAIAMLFVGYSSAYVVRRGIPTFDGATGTYSVTWEPLRLPIALLLFNTCLLISASGAIEAVRRRMPGLLVGKEQIKKGAMLWLNLSLLSGTGFLIGQGIAWHSLSSNAQFLSTGARTAFFYVLTGTHALHALLGVLALAVVAVFYARMSTVRKCLAIDLTAWYMHSMTFFWIYLLCFVLFA